MVTVTSPSWPPSIKLSSPEEQVKVPFSKKYH